jgi:hypothetical protein
MMPMLTRIMPYRNKEGRNAVVALCPEHHALGATVIEVVREDSTAGIVSGRQEIHCAPTVV